MENKTQSAQPTINNQKQKKQNHTHTQLNKSKSPISKTNNQKHATQQHTETNQQTNCHNQQLN